MFGLRIQIVNLLCRGELMKSFHFVFADFQSVLPILVTKIR